MAILNNSNAISSGGYDINNSLRFRASASAYLLRTPGTAGNRQKWTWSAWVKLGKPSDFYALFGSTNNCFIGYGQGTGGANLSIADGNTSTMNVVTTALFRDPSAWYHIVFALDTTQATASDRVKIYVNGIQQTSFVTATYPAQNAQFNINNTTAQNIGRTWDGFQYFDGYMTEMNHIDGQQLTPSSFGETSTTTGSWIPKAYSGTYGTNGFYLKFSDIATTSGSNAGLGKDFSGNANYWTTNNISVTAGTTYDAMIDSPTLTSATTANYPVMTPAYLPRGSYTLSEANLKCSGAYASSNYPRIMSSMGMTSGKYYWEYVGATFPATESCSIGIKEVNSSYPSATGGLGAVSGEIGLFNTGRLDNNGSTTGSFSTTFTTGDVIGMAFDATNGTLNYYKNGSALGSQITGIAAGTYAPAFDCLSTSQTVWNVNYGQRPFAQTPPTNYVRLNTYNLPDSTIKKGNTVMDANLWTGNGSAQTIVNQAQFKPDLMWIKSRSVNGYYHVLTDSVRGITKALYSNAADSENTLSTRVTAINSNGFSLGTSGDVNDNAQTFVGWQWQAGQGTNTSNTSGSITSTVSVNATAGFSIVLYTGNGGAMTVGHGLGVAPKLIILKDRDIGRPWPVYHGSLATNQYLILNTTAAAATSTSYWNNTAPTSTVFSVNGLEGNVGANGEKYVAYCWAEIAGFSKFGSYTGNGSADGVFVYLGFRPKFIMVKRTSSTGNWYVWDSSRQTYNAVGSDLYPNLSNAEGGTNRLDFLSNGFKFRDSDVEFNGSGATMIYMAFAESPFRNSLAR